MSSRKRVYGGSGRTVTPKLRAIADSPSFAREGRLSTLEACGAKRPERRRREDGDGRESHTTVARQLESEPGERCSHEDREDGARVHECDCGPGRVRPRALSGCEDHGERET